MSTSAEPNSTTLNIPQLALLLLVGFLAVRWILSSNNSPSTTTSAQRSGAASRGAGPRVNPRHVDTVAAMFPQLSRRDIMWDLQRNGGNVQMTTERVLSGRGLETPPPSFQPVIPDTSAQASSAGTAQARTVNTKPAGPDLIQRYNLNPKVSQDTDSSEPDSTGKTKVAWSTSKTERQTMLQKRREEMILAARRKMLEKNKDSNS